MDDAEIMTAIREGVFILEVRDWPIPVAEQTLGGPTVRQEVLVKTRAGGPSPRPIQGFAATEVLQRLLLPWDNAGPILTDAQLRAGLGREDVVGIDRVVLEQGGIEEILKRQIEGPNAKAIRLLADGMQPVPSGALKLSGDDVDVETEVE